MWWVWYLWISPVFWSLYGLVSTQLGDITDTMVLQNGSVTQVSLPHTGCMGWCKDVINLNSFQHMLLSNWDNAFETRQTLL